MEEEIKKLFAQHFEEQKKYFDGRFDQIDERFEKIDKRFDAQDKRFAKQDERFDAQDKRFAKQDKRFDAQDKRFEEFVDFVVNNMATKEDVLNVRKDVAHDIANLNSKIDTNFNMLMLEITSLRKEIKIIKQDIADLEERIGEDLGVYAEDIVDLKERVHVIEHKLELQQAC